jgi:hypothetical protein
MQLYHQITYFLPLEYYFSRYIVRVQRITMLELRFCDQLIGCHFTLWYDSVKQSTQDLNHVFLACLLAFVTSYMNFGAIYVMLYAINRFFRHLPDYFRHLPDHFRHLPDIKAGPDLSSVVNYTDSSSADIFFFYCGREYIGRMSPWSAVVPSR